MRNTVKWIILLAGVMWAVPTLAADFVVVVNPGVQVDHLSKEELKRIYQKEKTEWPGDGTIIPFDQSASSAVRRAFSKAVLGSTVAEVQNYWINKKMTGGVTGPKVFHSPTLVKKFVARTPGAIGYLAPDEVDDTVKVVQVSGL